MNKEQAINYIYETLYKNVFFNKLASYGYVPQNTQQAEQLLTLASHINMQEAMTGNVKVASTYNTPADIAIKQAVFQAAVQDPILYQAIFIAST